MNHSENFTGREFACSCGCGFGTREGDVDAAFKGAAHTAQVDLRNNRLIPHAVEPRACLASFETISGELTLRLTTQNPHLHRLLMSLASRPIALPPFPLEPLAKGRNDEEPLE